MSDPILSDDQARALVMADGPFYAMPRVLASHAALRSRLAEVKAERDEMRFIAENERARGDAAEARLAEAIKLLRRILTEWDEGSVPTGPEAVWYAAGDARAFIEAHGEG